MAIVFKSMLVAAAVLVVGFGAAGAVWAEPVSASRVIRDPLVKHAPNSIGAVVPDAAQSAVVKSAKAAVVSAKASKGSGKRCKVEVHCEPGLDKRGAGSTDRQAPAALEQVLVDGAKRSVPVNLRRPRYPLLGYTPGSVPLGGEFSTGPRLNLVGDFWHSMYRAARASTVAK
ncbi:MAG: hypothetical protein WC028_32240 [Candidatus Obscuribacterales bacterium]